MINEKHIAAAELVFTKAEELARRWYQAWKSSSYNTMRDVRLDFKKREICFLPYCYDGIAFHHQPYCSISFKYFEDDSTLEADSMAWFAKAEEERLKPFNRQRELEKIPEVQEWKNIESQRNQRYLGGGVVRL